MKALMVVIDWENHSSDVDLIEESLKKVSWFDTVFLKGPSWQDWPDFWGEELAKKAIGAVRMARKIPVLGRNLWMNAPRRCAERGGVQTPEDCKDPMFYVEAISRLKGEAAANGVAQVWMDAEGYNQGALPTRSPVSTYLQKLHTFGVDESGAVNAAAIKAAGTCQLDYIYPAESGYTRGYSWAMSWLGKYRMCHKSYYMKAPGAVQNVSPPDYNALSVDLWGHACGYSNPDHLSPREVMDFDHAAIRANYPENVGTWCWVPRSETKQILEDKTWET